MRVIALVSLALALAASSMPLSTRTNDVSVSEDGSRGSFTAPGSESGNAVYSQGVGSASTGGSASTPGGSFSAAGSGSESADNVHPPGSASGSASGSFMPSRRSTVPSPPSDVTGAASQAGSEAESAVGGHLPTTNPITHGTYPSRATTGSASGTENVVDTFTPGGATEQASGAGKTVSGSNGIPSSPAAAAAAAAAARAAGPFTGSGSSTQTGSTSD